MSLRWTRRLSYNCVAARLIQQQFCRIAVFPSERRTMTDQTSEIKKLSTLLEVSQALSGTLNLKAALHRVLEILEQQHGMIRSAVMLLNEATSELTIEAANGITADGQRQRYRLGEGIMGRVVESGKPVVVPQVS